MSEALTQTAENDLDLISPIQAEFLREYLINGYSVRLAAMKVKPNVTEQSARVWGQRVLAQHKETVRLIMEDKGLTLGKIVDKVNDGLEATVTAGKKKLPDFNTRHKYLGTAIDLMQNATPAGVPSGLPSQQFNQFNINLPKGSKMVEDFTKFIEEGTKRDASTGGKTT